MVFRPTSIIDFKAQYPDNPASLRHGLAGHPLLSLDRLLALTKRLAATSIEYNAGALPVGQDPAKTPMNGLSAEETIQRIADCQSWLVLKNIEQDADYAKLLEDCLLDVGPVANARTGAMHKKEGFIFVSSPRAVTPFHMDPEHNILLQIRGKKFFRLFPPRDPELVPPELHEAFHGQGGHRNLPWRDDFDARARVFEMTPGDALYVPVKAPHWVQVGGEISVSLSITWRSRRSDNEARLHRANSWLRAHGAAPSPMGAAPLRDQAKILTHRIVSRALRP